MRIIYLFDGCMDKIKELTDFYMWMQENDYDHNIRTRVEKTPEGPIIYMEVIVTYGYNVLSALREFKEKVRKEIEILTTMNVVDITIVAKGIYMPEEKKKED